MRDGNDHLFVRDHIFVIEVLRIMLDCGAALVSISRLHLQQFVLDNLHPLVFIGKDFLQLFNELHQLIIFILDLLPLHAGKTL